MTVVRGSGAGTAVREDGVPRGAGIGELELESGFRLPDVRIAYETGQRRPFALISADIFAALAGNDPDLLALRPLPSTTEAQRPATKAKLMRCTPPSRMFMMNR